MRHMGRNSLNGQSWGRCMSLMKGHPSEGQGGVIRVTHPMDTTQPLSLARMGSWTKWPWWQDTKYGLPLPKDCYSNSATVHNVDLNPEETH